MRFQHAQLSKAVDKIECELAVLSDLVSGYGKNFLAQEFCYGD